MHAEGQRKDLGKLMARRAEEGELLGGWVGDEGLPCTRHIKQHSKRDCGEAGEALALESGCYKLEPDAVSLCYRVCNLG